MTRKLDFAVSGLACGGGGAGALERALAGLAGVARVYVNPLTERAYLEYDPALTSPEAIQKVVERLGYRAEVPQLQP